MLHALLGSAGRSQGSHDDFHWWQQLFATIQQQQQQQHSCAPLSAHTAALMGSACLPGLLPDGCIVAWRAPNREPVHHRMHKRVLLFC